jgi:hypothetical protein
MQIKTADDAKTAMDAVHKGHAFNQYLLGCYTAFSINCIEDPNLTNFRLETKIQFGIQDNDQNPRGYAYLKREMPYWIIGSSFMSTVEIISSYLNNVYSLLRFLQREYSSSKLPLVQKIFQEEQRRFEWKSVNDKIKLLRKEVGFTPELGDVVGTMTKVRNVIAHSSGWVHQHHCDKGQDHLVLRWKGIKLSKLVDGSLVEVPDHHRGPALGPGQTGHFEVLIREKTFNVGQRIELSPFEMTDVLWSVSEAMLEIKAKVHAAADQALARGVKRNKLRLTIEGPPLGDLTGGSPTAAPPAAGARGPDRARQAPLSSGPASPEGS